MLHFRLDLVGTGEPRWGPPDTPVSVYGTTADGDDGVHLDVTGLRPFVTVALPTESPPFDEERVEELTSLLAPVLASAADYRGRRLKLGVCTQALEQTRVEYEQPPGPARTLRIVFNCSAVAAEVTRVLQAPEAAAAAWTYPLSVDADSLVAMLGDARGGIRVLAPETASNPTACFAARTGVAPKRWCTADTAWPDVEHEHDRPVTLNLEQFHPAATPLPDVLAKRRREFDEEFEADRERCAKEHEHALAQFARRAFDERLADMFEFVLQQHPKLHTLFSEEELRAASTKERHACKDRRARSRFVEAVESAKERCISQPKSNVRVKRFLQNIAEFRSTEAAFQFAFKTREEDVVDSMLRAQPRLHESVTEEVLRGARLDSFWGMAGQVQETRQRMTPAHKQATT